MAVNQWPGDGVGQGDTQKLPLGVEGYASKQIFFKTKEATEKYEGELPAQVVLDIGINCASGTITKTLSREGNTHHYN